MSLYDRPTHYSGVSLSTLDQIYLSLSGVNRYPKAFHFIPGSATKPGIAFQGNERMGLYQVDETTLGITVGGWKSLWVATGYFTLWGKKGFGVQVSLPAALAVNIEVELPNADGTLLVADYFVSEALTGTVDGVNDTFTTSETIAKLLDLQLGDKCAQPYNSATGTTIVFTTPPVSGTPRAIYIRA